MAQIKCDNCGNLFEDENLVNCPHCNAPIGTFKLIRKKDGYILEERTATFPKQGFKYLIPNYISEDSSMVFTYKEAKKKYDENHTYLDELKNKKNNN